MNYIKYEKKFFTFWRGNIFVFKVAIDRNKEKGIVNPATFL